MIKYINSDEFQKEVIESEGIVLVDFFATWCGPCQMLSQILENISNEEININIIKIDIDKETKLSIENKVSVVPTVIIYKNGEKVERFEGLRDKEEIIDIIKNI